MSHLDPLPADLFAVSDKASATHALQLSQVDEIIARLELARQHLTQPAEAEGGFADTLLPLSSFVKTANAKSGQASKEWGNAVTRLCKDNDKKFGPPPPVLFPPPPAPPPAPSHLHPALAALLPPSSTSRSSSSSAPPPEPTEPFSAPESVAALHASIATHLARLGAFSSLSSFLAESSTPAPPGLEEGGETLARLRELHAILSELREGKVQSAVEWVEGHPEADEGGELEYQLRREEFVRMVLASGGEGEGEKGSSLAGGKEADEAMETDDAPPPSSSSSIKPSFTPASPAASAALRYGGLHFRRLFTPQRSDELCALLTAPLYLPLPRLLSSPYGALFAPYLPSSSPAPSLPTTPPPTQALIASFSAAFLSTLSLPRDSPLSVVTDVGGSGALAKIMKVRQVMKEKKTEWTAVGELPVEIPLPLRYRYHSVFACPVSKEQSTGANPPMLLPCGHVIARESLARLARGTPTLKCPYCPVVSHFNACVRVHF
ncbi:hypothetical protein JCM8097_000023 [Rhodosporidiobolus ruineniae]